MTTTVLFTRKQAPGAIPNGSRVAKVKSESGDAHALGARATVLGSMPAGMLNGKILYFVEWDDAPGLPVAVADFKIAAIP